MAVITYGTDIAPHLQRALMYRRLRIRRWEFLHPRYDCDDYDPYAWARNSRAVDLISGLMVIAFFAAIEAVEAGFNELRLRQLAWAGSWRVF